MLLGFEELGGADGGLLTASLARSMSVGPFYKSTILGGGLLTSFNLF